MKQQVDNHCSEEMDKHEIKRQSLALYIIGITIIGSSVALSPLLITALVTKIGIFPKIFISATYLLLFTFGALFIRKARDNG